MAEVTQDYGKYTFIALEIKFDPHGACAVVLIFSPCIGIYNVKVSSPF